MATLTATLTLGSSNTISNESLALTISKDHTVEKPLVNSGSVLATAAGAVAVFAATAGVRYVYAKNTDNSNSADLQRTAGPSVVSLGPGEFCFLPWVSSTGLSAQGIGGDVTVEYAFFTKS